MEAFRAIIGIPYEYGLELLFVVPSVVVSYWFAVTLWSKYRRLPPGPIGLPLVGYWPFLLFSMEKRLKEIGEKYGPVYGMKLGTKYLVVLNDYDTTIEAYRKDATNARPDFEFHNFSKLNHFGGMKGQEWRDHRKYFVAYLKNLYRNEQGVLNLQDILFEEVKSLINQIDVKIRNKEDTFNVRNLMREATNNVLFRYLFSLSLPFEHPLTQSLANQHRPFLNQSVPFTFLACFRELRWILRHILPSQRTLKRTSAEIANFFQDQIDKHRQTLDAENPRDYVDHFLIKQLENPNDPSYCDEILNNNCQLILLGGTDTVRTSLEWIFVLMAKNPDIQEKICREIHEVFGKEQKPRWEDRYLLPYTTATVFECQRWKTLVPFSSVRIALEDITVKGYVIPKGSHLTSNLMAIHNDETYWKDPSEFKPERYMDENGKLNMTERLAAFSYGKRDCPGSQQALIELFYVLVAVLQRYQIKPPPGGISLEEDKGLIHGPASPIVKFVNRS